MRDMIIKFMELHPIILGWLLGTISSLCGILLQFFLTRQQTKNQFLLETRRAVYAKLLSATISEGIYPKVSNKKMTEKDVDQFNEKWNKWRKNRKMIKGLTAEALLLAQDHDLQDKLSEFISTYNPDERLTGVTELMRKEIGL